MRLAYIGYGNSEAHEDLGTMEVQQVTVSETEDQDERNDRKV